MLVLNTHFSLLASLLTVLIFTSTSPLPTAHALAVRATRDSSEPSTTTLADGTVHTQNPSHQDRPSELGLPEGAEPSSAASRKGMSKAGRWGGDGSKTKTWTGTWTGTKAWAKPTSTEYSAPGPKVDDDDELSKREFGNAKQGVVLQDSRRRHHVRSSQRGHAGRHHSSRRHPRDISIDSDHGERYVVQKGDKSRTPESAYRQRRFLMRRKVKRGTPGVINIMSHVNNAQPGKKIASLYLESQKKDDQYVLNASEKDSTEVYLVPTIPPSGGSRTTVRRSSSKATEMLVSLRVELEGQEYCATYDPNPPGAEPLTMQPCMEPADDSKGAEEAKDVDAAKDRDPENHKSQTFSFNPDSGVIRPMWFAGEVDGKAVEDGARASDASDDEAAASSAVSSASPTPTVADSDDSPSSSVVSSGVTAADTSLPTSVDPSSSDPSSAPSATPTSSLTTREPGSVQNVTLVFVPSPKAGTNAVGDAPSSSILPSAPLPSETGVSSSDDSSDSASAFPSQSASAASGDSSETTASVFTKTVTVTASAEATPTGDTADASDDDDDDDGASSTTTITISSAALPSATPSSSQGTLSVQVVGDDGKTVGDDDPSTSNPPMGGSGDSAASSASASASAGAAAVETPAASSSASASPAAQSSATPPLPAVPLITQAPKPPVPINPMAVASEVAQSYSASQSAAAAAASDSVTPSPSQSAPDAVKSEIVAVKDSRTINSRIARRQLMPVSTAPYKWLFKLGGI